MTNTKIMLVVLATFAGIVAIVIALWQLTGLFFSNPGQQGLASIAVMVIAMLGGAVALDLRNRAIAKPNTEQDQD